LIDEVYLTGSTVRLSAKFTDVEGIPKNPDTVKVVLYDYRFNKLEEFVLGEENHVGTGEYVFDYITPMIERKIHFEFYGEISGNPVIERDSFVTKFEI
jgi:hypothetical protein